MGAQDALKLASELFLVECFQEGRYVLHPLLLLGHLLAVHESEVAVVVAYGLRPLLGEVVEAVGPDGSLDVVSGLGVALPDGAVLGQGGALEAARYGGRVEADSTQTQAHFFLVASLVTAVLFSALCADFGSGRFRFGAHECRDQLHEYPPLSLLSCGDYCALKSHDDDDSQDYYGGYVQIGDKRPFRGIFPSFACDDQRQEHESWLAHGDRPLEYLSAESLSEVGCGHHVTAVLVPRYVEQRANCAGRA